MAYYMALWYSPDPDYLDSDGYYISPEFVVESGVSGSLSSGEIGAAQGPIIEELFGNTIYIYIGRTLKKLRNPLSRGHQILPLILMILSSTR